MRIEESGLLLRLGGGFALRRDGGGGILRLDLSRTPVDLVGKRVLIAGQRIDDGRIEVDSIRAAGR